MKSVKKYSMSIEKQEMAIKKACQYLLKNCPTSMDCVELKAFYAVPENVNDIKKCFWNLMFYNYGGNHKYPAQSSGLILKMIVSIQNEAPKFSQFVICSLMKKQMKELQAFIIGKNKSYGGSVFNHTGFHSQLNALEKIKVRIDDKINRDFCGGKYDNEDTIKDLLGYYVLYIAVEMYEKHKETPEKILCNFFEKETENWKEFANEELDDLKTGREKMRKIYNIENAKTTPFKDAFAKYMEEYIEQIQNLRKTIKTIWNKNANK